MRYAAEAVTAWHPDKICDQVSDGIVDACLQQDPMSRVAVEAIGGHNTIVLIGEVTTNAEVDFGEVARHIYFDLTGKHIGVLSNIVRQSPEISQGVDRGGAGDQGVMVGYACSENELKIPHELYLARKLLAPFHVDGKSQVVLEGDRVKNVVLSVQGEDRLALDAHISTFLNDRDIPRFCNNTGSFETGGFDADSGVTGRKLVIDAYGPRVPVGGGAFSGKDATKVDRSGAYMARFIALDVLKTLGPREVYVYLGYAIGEPKPVMLKILADGQLVSKNYDCRPRAIIERFELRRPIYLDTAKNGHFGRPELPWERV